MIKLAVIAVLACLVHSIASAADAITTRAAAIRELEASQNANGSFGDEEFAPTLLPTITAEVLRSLAAAGRCDGPAARRAVVWLRHAASRGVDAHGRRVRALQACGAALGPDVDALHALAIQSGTSLGRGWGLTSRRGITSYDTSLALGGLLSAGRAATTYEVQLGELLTRRARETTPIARAGWAVDGFVAASVGSVGEPTVTAEIMRALAPLALTNVQLSTGSGGSTLVDVNPAGSDFRDVLQVQEIMRFVGAPAGGGGAPLSSAVSSLEIAARLAALRAYGYDETGGGGFGQAALEAELLQNARLNAQDVWSSDDVLTNALGLLALTTKPNANWDTSSDWDGDEEPNATDPFPYDPLEWADLDRDGVGDHSDPDRDGDGTPNALDVFPDDATESTDLDGDLLGDSADPDDDGDGVDDDVERESGTNPYAEDTDGDGTADGADDCPLLDELGAEDSDGDGHCDPVDECANDPLGWTDLDGDAFCDHLDPDIDGDGSTNLEELHAGTDPRNDLSVPPPTNGTDDTDGDGLADNLEPPSSPWIVDSDADGATDFEEFGAGTNRMSATSRPAIAKSVLATSGVGSDPASPGLMRMEIIAAGVRSTLTGGQPTPVAPRSLAVASGAGSYEAIPGFQPQTMAFDADGDGLSALAEARQRTSSRLVDSDGDGFTDGPDGFVAVSDVAGGHDLLGNGTAAGERGDLSSSLDDTDPTSATSRPGIDGDIAPLGRPDGRVNAADALVALRCVEQPALVTTLSPGAAALTQEAGDLVAPSGIGLNDLLLILETATND